MTFCAWTFVALLLFIRSSFSIPVDTQEAAIQTGVESGTSEDWWEVYDRYRNGADTQTTLEGMAHTKNISLLQE